MKYTTYKKLAIIFGALLFAIIMFGIGVIAGQLVFLNFIQNVIVKLLHLSPDQVDKIINFMENVARTKLL